MKNFSCAIVGSVFAVSLLTGCRQDEPDLSERTADAGKPPAVLSTSDLGPVNQGTPPPALASMPMQRPGMASVSMPPADETVTGNYKTDRGEIIEVEGVCKISEDSISCWRWDGSAHADLASRVKDAIEFQHRLGGTWNYGVAYGKKNRVVVFKWTHPMAGDRTSLGLMNVGDLNTGAYMNLSLRSVNQPANGVEYQTRMAATDLSAKTTSARLVLYTTIPEPPRIEPKVGAKAAFGGETFTITGIKTGAPSTYHVPPNSGPSDLAWTISIKSTQKTKPPLEIYLNPLDAKDDPIRYVDAKGSVASAEAYRKAMDEYNAKVGKGAHPMTLPRPKYGLAFINVNEKPDGVIEVVTHVNPAKVKSFRIGGVRKKQIDLTGIPLDPK